MQMRRFVVVAVAACAVVAGLVAVAHTSARPEAVEDVAAEYSAEQYYAGIFFGMGPVAGLLPSADPPPAEGREVAEDLMEHISTGSPEFLASFKQSVTSGDHVRIRSAIEQGARVLADAMKVVAPDLAAAARTDSAVETYAETHTAVAVAFAVVVAVALVVVLTMIDFTPIENQIELSGLIADQYVHEIATKLSLR